MNVNLCCQVYVKMSLSCLCFDIWLQNKKAANVGTKLNVSKINYLQMLCIFNFSIKHD